MTCIGQGQLSHFNVESIAFDRPDCLTQRQQMSLSKRPSLNRNHATENTRPVYRIGELLPSFALQFLFFGSSHMPLATVCKNVDKNKRTARVATVFQNHGSSKPDQMPRITIKERAMHMAIRKILEITISRLNPVIDFESVLSVEVG